MCEDLTCLIEQAERAQIIEEEKEFFRRSLVELKAVENILTKENSRMREALEAIAEIHLLNPNIRADYHQALIKAVLNARRALE